MNTQTTTPDPRKIPTRIWNAFTDWEQKFVLNYYQRNGSFNEAKAALMAYRYMKIEHPSCQLIGHCVYHNGQLYAYSKTLRRLKKVMRSESYVQAYLRNNTVFHQ